MNLTYDFSLLKLLPNARWVKCRLEIAMKNIKSHLFRLADVTTNLVIIFLLIAALAASRGKVFGKENSQYISGTKSKTTLADQYSFLKNENYRMSAPGIWQKFEDENLVKTALFCKQFSPRTAGYEGAFEFILFLDSQHKVINAEFGRGFETPSFIRKIKRAGWLEKFKGKTSQEIVTGKFDTLSRATLTTEASILYARNGCRAYNKFIGEESSGSAYAGPAFLTYKNIAVLLVIFSALIVALIFRKNKYLRYAQLVLNVVVLGFWLCNMLSMQFIIGNMFAGFNSNQLAGYALIAVAVLMMLAGKKNFYCSWLCPFGALQELTGRLIKYKLKLPHLLIKILSQIRKYLLLALLGFAWITSTTSMFNLEPFSGFALQSAAPVVLVIAGLSVVISLVLPRCWCRFFCPTGALLSFAEYPTATGKMKSKNRQVNDEQQ